MKRLSRREFFRTTGFVALGAFAAACSKKLKITPGTTTLAKITSGHQETVQMNTAGLEILPFVPDRLVFNLIDQTNQNAITLPSVPIYIARDQHSAVTSLTATYRVDGLPADRGFYEAPINLAPGVWLVDALFTRPGHSADLAAGQFAVGPQTRMPKPGEKAPSVASPTYADHRGVNPICTRNPPCSMHAISLDTALRNGKPTVLIISTPKFCTSALCGPETDIVQSASKSFSGRINFLHIEVYKDDRATTIQRQILSPAAAAWHLEQEPAIYYIDKTGTIRSRTIGPADIAEVHSAATALAG